MRLVAVLFDCIEPGTCAITKDTRWWEMRETLTELFAQDDLTLDPDRVAMFFCRHHCDPAQHDVGGIPFATIRAETDRVCRHANDGADQIGVATFSSCHGVLTRLTIKRSRPHAMSDSDAPIVELEAWTGPWSADDLDANFKADVAAHSPLRPTANAQRAVARHRDSSRCASPLRTFALGNPGQRRLARDRSDDRPPLMGTGCRG